MAAFFKRSSSKNSPPRRRAGSLDLSLAPDSSRNFLRNRTLSGVKRPVDDVPSERTRAHQLAIRRRQVAVVFGLILVAMALTGLILGQFTARQSVVVTQSELQKTLDTSSYIDTLNEYFANHPVERLRFSLSGGQLTEFFVDHHPEVASISQVTVWGTGETQFAVTLRRPIAGWEIGGKQYYVDEDGVAFEKNYFEVPSVQIVDDSGVTLEQGTAVTSTRFLSLIGKIVALSSDRGYTVTSATLPLGTTREVDVRLKGVTPYIKFSIDRGVGEQIEDMDRSLTHLGSKGLRPSYVDVRVEGRAYYQ